MCNSAYDTATRRHTGGGCTIPQLAAARFQRTPGTHSRGKRRMKSRRSQEEPRGARRSQEQPAAARGGEPGGARRSQTNRLASHTDCPGQAQAALLIAGTPSHLQGIKAKQAPQHGWTSLPGPVGQTVPWPKGQPPRHRRPTRWGCWHLATPNSPW